MKKIAHWRAALSLTLLAAAVTVGAAIFLVTTNSAKAELPDMPAFTMTYPMTVQVGDQTISQVRELVYNTRDSWTETVTKADTIEAWGGTDSDLGSYRKVQGGQYTFYDASTGMTHTDTILEGHTMPPFISLQAMPVKAVEDFHDMKAVKVESSATKVCFNHVCTENASGWLYNFENQPIVIADDARGIPIKFGNFVATEVRIHSEKRPISRDTE